MPASAAELTDEPHRPFGAALLLLVAGEGFVAGWAFWMMGSPHEWPAVIVTVFLAYGALWHAAGMCVAGIAWSLLAAAAPVRDVVAKALAAGALVGHAIVLAVVLCPIVIQSWSR